MCHRNMYNQIASDV